MSNINVRVVGSANLAKIQGPFAELQTQVAATNVELGKFVALNDSVDAKGYENMTKAAAMNSKAFRNAAASTGMFEVQQLRVNRATEDYVKLLQKQQLSFKKMRQQRDIATKAYKEQLAMENMLVRQNQGGTVHNKSVLDVAYPKLISKDLDTAANRLMFFNEQLKSGAHQMVNWGKNTQWAGRQLMVGLTMPVAAFGAAAGVMAYKVDQQLTRIAKVYDTTAQQGIARENELKKVREDSMKTAISSAKAYGASATDTLDVASELAATGQKGLELQKATSEVMRISTLGELDHADAIKTTIALQSVFKMNNEDLTKSFNYMNAVENATSLATKDFAAAIPIAAGPVKQFGGDIQELGVLLTAMKSRGIEATQGANAIKAAMQRLGRPSKQVQEEWTALTGTDITKLFNQSTSLLDLFTKIGDATDQLTDKDKIRAFSGLFGTYQVTRMTALVDGMKDLGDATTQTGMAYKLAQGNSEDWAKTAQQEIETYQKSISGKWQTAFNTFMIELSTLGKPFVEVATVIISSITKIIEAFNAMPKVLKLIIAGGIGIAALAGPIVMLTGLFANLFGNGLKVMGFFLGRIAKLGGAMELATVEQRAAAAAAKLGYTEMTKEAEATAILTEQIQLLTKAMMEAHNISFGAMGLGLGSPLASPAAGKGLILPPGLSGKGAVPYGPQAEETSKKLVKNWSHVATTVGMAATALALFAGTENDAAAGAANILIMASLLAPAFMGAAKALKSVKLAEVAGNIASKIGSGFMAMSSSIGTATKSAFSFRSSLKGAAGGVMSLAGGFARLVGPANLAALAVVGIGYGIYKWRQHLQEVHDQQVRVQSAISNNADRWAEKMGKVAKEYDRIAGATLTIAGTKPDQFQSDLALYSSGGDLHAQTTAYQKTPEQSRMNVAKQQFVDLQVTAGMSATRAAQALSAMFVAAGDSMSQANAKAQELVKTVGELKNINWADNLANQAELFKAAIASGNTDVAERSGKDFAEAFSMGLQRSKPGSKMEKDLMDELDKFASSGFQDTFASMEMGASDFLKTNGIKNADDLASYYQEALGDPNKFNGIPVMFRQALAGSQATANETVKLIADYNHWGSEVQTIADLHAQIDVYARSLNYSQGLRQVDLWTGKMKFLFDAQANLFGVFGNNNTSEAMQMNAVNAMNVAHGFKEGSTLAQAMANYVGKVKDETTAAARAAGGLASAWRATKDEIANVYQTSMSGVQQDIANDISNNFDTRMNNALDARQAYWDRRSDALNAELDRKSNALDAKWQRKQDAADKYWDHRIELVDKEIEAEKKADDIRQKLFNAEIARIERLNSMANANIDFNVALNSGNLDEAAKIRNDAMAEDARTTLEKAMAQGTAKSNKRVNKLEGRKDNIAKARDKAMQAMQKREEAEKAHLERISKMRQDALQRDSDADMAARREEWDAEKQSLQDRLDLFLAYIAKNGKDLKKHMEQVGLSYKDFGNNVLKPRGEDWSTYFGDRMQYHVRKSGLELASDKMWEVLGNQSVNAMLKGMGFSGMAQFRHFVMTGEMKNFGKGPQGTSYQGDNSGDATPQGYNARHAGGTIGPDAGSRVGVARTLKGLHSSERMILAQDGEFMVNRKAAAKNGPILNAINNGYDVTNPTGGENPSVAGLMAAALNRAMLSGLNKSMNNLYAQGLAKQAANAMKGMMGFGKIGAGKYGDIYFDATQAKNAQTIANVGKSMGMNSRDIEIGIMTAITESGLRNVNYGDRDSLGLFQQRPSQGWGTPAQVTDPEYAARKFFSVLKGVSDRGSMSPWLAAQAVQRSAYPDGSNYRPNWNEAIALFNAMGRSGSASGPSQGGYVAGQGGWHKASVPGKGWVNTHDYRNELGSPLYAASDGVVVDSRAITSGGSPGNGAYSTPYRSYGETIAIRTASGDVLRYAHLSPGKRFVSKGQKVKGGALIGRSGMTGNATGPHTHFDVNGDYNASGWMRAHGIGLSKGAAEIKWDNTIANLHHGEGVLTKDLNAKMHQGIENFANGGNAEYNVEVNLYGAEVDADEVANKTVTKIKRMERRKPRSRKRGN